jgi:hypothetical protein
MTRACFAIIFILSLFPAGCEGTDIDMVLQAGADAVRAATLDDEGVHRLAVEIASRSDREHTVAPPGNPHAKRLARLTGGPSQIDGYEFDFKVYLSPKVNAFAMADGTIRIYSGLMDKMTDGELLFVIGHEIGHVVGDHIEEKLRLAYAGSAVRKAIASQQNEAGDIARSIVGALAESLLNASSETYLKTGGWTEGSYCIFCNGSGSWILRFVIFALEKRVCPWVPDGIAFMDDARRSFPWAGGQNSDLSQSEFSSTGRAAFRVEGVEFFEINDQGVFPAEGVFHGGHSCSLAGGAVVHASACFLIIQTTDPNSLCQA